MLTAPLDVRFREAKRTCPIEGVKFAYDPKRTF